MSGDGVTGRGYRPHRRTPTAAVARGVERRFQIAGLFRHQVNKVFPWHFSFLWGEIALYSFVVLVGSGVFLTLFYVPSMDELVYQGSYVPTSGLEGSRAWISTMQLSIDVRGGLFVRQLHHWSALVFLAAVMLHMGRIFFTGAYRAPREINWFLGVAMLVLAIFEGYLGYSMIDDLLSGTGVRIFSGILLSVPVIGTWLHWLVFSGEYPGEIVVERFFIAHVLLIPAILAGLIVLHLAVVWYQKHTQFAGPPAGEGNVVGNRTLPVFSLHSVSMLLGVTGVLGLLAGVAQINPIFHYGPYNPTQVSNGSQPDWYALWLIGSLKLFPRVDIAVFGRYTVPAGFWAGVAIPLVLILLLLAWPLVDRLRTRDRELHNLLDRPRDDAARTAIGVMALTFWGVLTVAGADDIAATVFQIPLEGLRWAERGALLILPPLAYVITRRVCLRLQRSDRDALAGGVATGIVEETTEGTYRSVQQPFVGVDPEGGEHPPRYDGARIPKVPAREHAEGSS
ncbi:cytochrome b [Actinomycetospora callitridis]|uniref:cytochrome bc1 complex cytochrome b subunit n=1 Tax=Actinomycetospora callitridis TaxID=913944 RepID=UPI002366ED31|nr:cytochrome bc complex cytochrome b subunit [Actinomycetospora callitridis]MDD7920381.1 cytochrome bc complex cytochrome b subunit [Actinomycetospora callitridis]